MLDGYLILTNGQNFRLKRNVATSIWCTVNHDAYKHEVPDVEVLLGNSCRYGQLSLNGVEVQELLLPVGMRNMTIINSTFVNKFSLPMYDDMDIAIDSASKIDISNLHMFANKPDTKIVFNCDKIVVPNFNDILDNLDLSDI